MATKTDFDRNRVEFIQTRTKKALDPVSKYFTQQVGPIEALEPIALSATHDVWLNRCAVRGEQMHVLFSVGLNVIAGSELYLVLPASEKPWPVLRFLQSPLDESSFPVDLLQALTASLARKGSAFRAEPGVVLDREEKRWSQLRWDHAPGRVQGFVLVDHDWPAAGKSTSIETRLLALVPFSTEEKDALRIRKGRATADLSALQSAPWPRLALPWQERMVWQQQLNVGVLKSQPELVLKALASGADPNRLAIRDHCSFGHYADKSLLSTALGYGNETIVRSLIEHGAEVPSDAIACLINWGNRDLIMLLQAHGADINAVSADMTALERAKAFKNHELMRVLTDLGAKRR